MRIDIKLDDSRYCDGCPCLHKDTEEPTACSLNYPDEYEYLKFQEIESGKFRYIRLQRCIDEHGE
jgi:hypothetical protein